MAELKSISISQEQEKSFCGEAYNDNGYIFASSLGECIEPRTMQDVFKRILKTAEVADANFHALRHTFATRALEAGVPAKVVSEILGHANVSTTLDLYSHVLLDTKREAMNRINGVLPE
jgi:site-specific recombinase XerD